MGPKCRQHRFLARSYESLDTVQLSPVRKWSCFSFGPACNAAAPSSACSEIARHIRADLLHMVYWRHLAQSLTAVQQTWHHIFLQGQTGSDDEFFDAAEQLSRSNSARSTSSRMSAQSAYFDAPDDLPPPGAALSP